MRKIKKLGKIDLKSGTPPRPMPLIKSPKISGILRPKESKTNPRTKSSNITMISQIDPIFPKSPPI